MCSYVFSQEGAGRPLSATSGDKQKGVRRQRPTKKVRCVYRKKEALRVCAAARRKGAGDAARAPKALRLAPKALRLAPSVISHVVLRSPHISYEVMRLGA
jgi:hypothetical protein